MAEAAERLITVDEFLALEDSSDTRTQLVRGVVTAMAPPQASHGELVVELGSRLRAQLPRPCRVVAEAGIKPRDRGDTFWQADLAVTCSPRQRGEVYLTEPRVVIEVLSPSTEGMDRSLKLDDYRQEPSITDIVLLKSDEARAEHWRRQEGLWRATLLGPGHVLELADFEIRIAIDELYARLLDAAEGETEQS